MPLRRTHRRIYWGGGLALALLSIGCGDDSPAEVASTTGTSTGPTGPTGPADTGPDASVTSTPPPPDGSSSGEGGTDPTTGVVDEGTGTTGDPDTEGSSSGGIPFPCDDPALPVMVVGGGAYRTIQAAVDATPDGGEIQICPGEYPESIQIVRSITITGAGTQEVTILGSPGEQVIDSSDVDLSLADFTLRGGQVGIWAGNADDHSVSLTRVSIEDMEQYGIYVWASGNGSIDTTFVDIVDSNISGVDAPADGAGVFFQRLTATLTDTTVTNNRAVALGGGFRIDASHVTVTGGQVHANEAASGGGARLQSGGVPIDPIEATLTVVASDWGAGMALENYEADVRCYENLGGFPVPVAGFLGAAADAVCTSEGLGADCCL